METITIRRVPPAELTWLVRVHKSRHPLSLTLPIWVRWEEENSDLGFGSPEIHPYCEVGVILEGAGPIYVEKEEVHRLAAAGLRDPGHNVSKVAFAVGYQSLSHFNTTFREIMGMSPSEYTAVAAQAPGSKPK